MLYDEFKPVVDVMLDNWTALQLAVDNGMGMDSLGGVKTAQLMADYIARYCVENVVDVNDLTEVLEDLMDEEFDTICDDGSPKEVATLLLQLLEMLKLGHQDEVRTRIESMPKCQKWLSRQAVIPTSHGNPVHDTTSSSDEDDNNDTPNSNVASAIVNDSETAEPEPMEQDVDPGWKVVQSRRKKK